MPYELNGVLYWTAQEIANEYQKRGCSVQAVARKARKLGLPYVKVKGKMMGWAEAEKKLLLNDV